LLYVTNIGDSRSVIGYKEDSKLFFLTLDVFKSKQLSFDHKAEVHSEKKRILSNNGRVSSIIDNSGRSCGPLRVWLKNEQLPGLAMTRSIGDLVAESVGVTWKPEIAIYKLC
jgi:serine/threonine protein phosphatase PrpC